MTKKRSYTTDAARCRRNHWKVGDVIENEYGEHIRLTAIGEDCVLAVYIYYGSPEQECEGEWVLGCVRWRRIGRWDKRTRKVVKP